MVRKQTVTDKDWLLNIRSLLGDTSVQKIQKAEISLIGAGTIGSNLVCSLAGNGFKRFILVDGDTISERNIPLCLPYRLQEVEQPKTIALKNFLVSKYGRRVEVQTYSAYVGRVPIQVITAPDILILAVDNNATKLFVTYNRVKVRKPMIVLGFWGWEASYMLVLPQKTACWACLFRPRNRKEVKLMKKASSCPKPEPNIPGAVIQGTVSQLVGIAANEITKFCLNIGRTKQYHAFHALLGDKDIRFLDMNNYLKPDADCPICRDGEWTDVSRLREQKH